MTTGKAWPHAHTLILILTHTHRRTHTYTQNAEAKDGERVRKGGCWGGGSGGGKRLLNIRAYISV